jgi:hypothetical protein
VAYTVYPHGRGRTELEYSVQHLVDIESDQKRCIIAKYSLVEHQDLFGLTCLQIQKRVAPYIAQSAIIGSLL